MGRDRDRSALCRRVDRAAHDLIVDAVPLGLAPRRTQLDAVLVEAAVAAGVQLRDRFAVQD